MATGHPGAHLDLLDAATPLGLLGAPDGDALPAVAAEPAVRGQTLVSEGQKGHVIRDLHLHAGRFSFFLLLQPDRCSPAGPAADDVTGQRRHTEEWQTELSLGLDFRRLNLDVGNAIIPPKMCWFTTFVVVSVGGI